MADELQLSRASEVGTVETLSGSHLAAKGRFARAGHQEVLGETITKFELFKRGWNPYSRFLDHEKVDIVARKNTGSELLYADIQVKQNRLFRVGESWAKPIFDFTSWGFFNPGAFDHSNPHLIVVIVLMRRDEDVEGPSVTDYAGDIFLFSARQFSELLRAAIPSRHLVKVFIARSAEDESQWYWCRQWKRGMTLDQDCVIDVTCRRGAFEVIDEHALRHCYR